MSLAVVYTRALLGVDAPLVTVETHISGGLPKLAIVGLPETAVKESKDRVRSAILNSHFEFPARRITINLAPADLPKDGGRFDLAIALGILAASGQIPPAQLKHCEVLGELALSGELRGVPASLPAALAAAKESRALIVPLPNASEAALSSSTQVLAANNLLQVCAHLNGNARIEAYQPESYQQNPNPEKDLEDVKGQALARRALEIAASGQHNLLFYGPPGTGKTMLAQRLPGILPALTEEQAIEVAAIHSINQGFNIESWRQRPFRHPHHSASSTALVGGGANPKPGEISLAHNGVLFLDELPEFPRTVLEVLREPLENGEICISRAKAQVNFPARFQFISAMNPCPCGYFGSTVHSCRCSPDQIRRYRDRLSGPLLDRIDLHVPVQAIPVSALHQAVAGEPSAVVAARVATAYELQLKRQGAANAQLGGKDIEHYCALDKKAQLLLNQSMEALKLSARAYHRILKVARTIADLAGEPAILPTHIGEALSYRNLDRSVVDA